MKETNQTRRDGKDNKDERKKRGEESKNMEQTCTTRNVGVFTNMSDVRV